MDEFLNRIGRFGIFTLQGVSGRSLTTFGSGGKVSYVTFPANAKQTLAVLDAAKTVDLPVRVIGGGSNLLLPDEGYDGVLIRLSAMDAIEISGANAVVGAGAKMPVLANALASCGLSGAEFACGIPGTMGGAAAVNAGAFGQSAAELITEITALTAEGKVETLDPRAMEYGYHRAALPQGMILLSVKLRLASSDRETVTARMREMRQKRRCTQPKGPSAGSVFRRVGEIPAALYVEKTGLKGTQVGGALLSKVHCNFIVNAGGATTEDYFTLAERVKQSVKAQEGVLLEYEVERIC